MALGGAGGSAGSSASGNHQARGGSGGELQGRAEKGSMAPLGHTQAHPSGAVALGLRAVLLSCILAHSHIPFPGCFISHPTAAAPEICNPIAHSMPEAFFPGIELVCLLKWLGLEGDCPQGLLTYFPVCGVSGIFLVFCEILAQGA